MQINGRLIVDDGEPELPPLTVHFYRTETLSVPPHVLNESAWDALYFSGWKGFDVFRLGASLSGSDGQFAFNDLSEPGGPATGRRPHLWIAVTGADLNSALRCERVVLAACDIRANATMSEAFALYLDSGRLRRLGLLSGANGAPSTIAPGRLRSQIEAVVAARPAEIATDKPFSAIHADQLEALQVDTPSGALRPGQPGFSLTVALQDDAGASVAAVASLGAGLHISDTAGSGQDLPLRYAGLSRESAVDGQLGVRVDTATGDFQLVLQSVPDSLRRNDV